MFECGICKSELEHINFQFWFCGKCVKIVDISVTQNWKNDEPFTTFINNDIKTFTHNIRRESHNDFIKIIPDLMILEVL